MLEAELRATVVAAGFEDFKITWTGSIFEDVPRPSSDALILGTKGINFMAVKPRLPTSP
ncbi:MAG: hypothetical protein ACR2QM_17075 [Longimicrobiales bacterium]